MTAQEFLGLLPPQSTRPRASFHGPAGTSTILRDQFTLQTWLAFGAVLQTISFFVLGRYALLPAALYLAAIGFDTVAISLGWKSNPCMADVIPHKFSAQMRDAHTGSYGSKPADSELVVFLIGTRCNHPLGALAPGFREMGGYFVQMATDLDSHAEEFGFLGMTSWLNGSERSSNSQLLEIAYFRTPEGLHNFAHSEYHRKGWTWWTQHTKKYPHLSIYHETYHVPKGHWENIYVNSHAGGITSTTYKVDTPEGEKWASPIVDASRGLLKTSRGRMSRSRGDEHDEYGL